MCPHGPLPADQLCGVIAPLAVTRLVEGGVLGYGKNSWFSRDIAVAAPRGCSCNMQGARKVNHDGTENGVNLAD